MSWKGDIMMKTIVFDKELTKEKMQRSEKFDSLSADEQERVILVKLISFKLKYADLTCLRFVNAFLQEPEIRHSV